ncbi:hypothetical protein [Mycoplasmoides genitalium]
MSDHWFNPNIDVRKSGEGGSRRRSRRRRRRGGGVGKGFVVADSGEKV